MRVPYYRAAQNCLLIFKGARGAVRANPAMAPGSNGTRMKAVGSCCPTCPHAAAILHSSIWAFWASVYPCSKGLSSELDAVLKTPFFKLLLPGLQLGLRTLNSGQTAIQLEHPSVPFPHCAMRSLHPKSAWRQGVAC
jgi:hypothetical protein